MKHDLLLDEVVIGMGVLIMSLSAILYIAVLMPIGVGSVVIGMVGLKARSIKECITESRGVQ